MAGADPGAVSDAAKRRQRDEMGTLGSGNHYLEVQHVTAVYDAAVAQGFGLAVGDVVVSIHCGSRGLGHQIGSEFLREMAIAAAHLLFLRAHIAVRRTGHAGRARVGSIRSQRRKSSANSIADGYRWPGSFRMAFRQMAAKSRGRRRPPSPGGVGSSESTFFATSV